MNNKFFTQLNHSINTQTKNKNINNNLYNIIYNNKTIIKIIHL